MATGRRSDGPSKAELEHDAWARMMRGVRVISRLLAAILVALIARILIAGPGLVTVLVAAAFAALLLASLLLARYGRGLEPPG